MRVVSVNFGAPWPSLSPAQMQAVPEYVKSLAR